MDLEKIPTLEEYNLDETITNDKVKLISDIVGDKPKVVDRFKSGFSEFDNIMEGGFKEGDLVVISGISGEGKTTFAQTLTYNFCKLNIPTLWFSYEVSLTHLDRKFREMGISDFYHAYSPEKNTTGKLDWVKFKIKESWRNHLTKVIFIDHIDFLTPDDNKTSDNESISLKKIATQLKTLAIELNVTIVLIAHLKKLPAGKEPDMQDIGHSAGIFQLADYVFIVWREKINNGNKFSSENTEIATNRSIIKLVKNRETGQLKYIKCQYDRGKYTQETKRDEGDNSTSNGTEWFNK